MQLFNINMIEKIKLNEFKTTYKNNLLFFNIYFIFFTKLKIVNFENI